MTHPVGVIHGRFQVLHNDHLAYLLAGKALCDHLIVGITNPDPTLTTCESSDLERSADENNPLTYFERFLMVRAALLEAGIPLEDFSVVPLPICCPTLIRNYAPGDAVYYLTIYDDWGKMKKHRLESLGLTTHVMWQRPEEQKGLSGTDVRTAIRDGGDWKSMVPRSVVALVEEWDLQKRLGKSFRPCSMS